MNNFDSTPQKVKIVHFVPESFIIRFLFVTSEEGERKTNRPSRLRQRIILVSAEGISFFSLGLSFQ